MVWEKLSVVRSLETQLYLTEVQNPVKQTYAIKQLEPLQK